MYNYIKSNEKTEKLAKYFYKLNQKHPQKQNKIIKIIKSKNGLVPILLTLKTKLKIAGEKNGI